MGITGQFYKGIKETDLNKSGTYFSIPFKCNVLCIRFVCFLMYLYLNKILFTLKELRTVLQRNYRIILQRNYRIISQRNNRLTLL